MVFAFDSANNYRRWNCKNKKILSNGVDQTNSFERFNGMFKDDGFFRFRPSNDGKVMATIHEKDSMEFTGHRSKDFDPTFFFTINGLSYDCLDSFISTKESEQDVEHIEPDDDITPTPTTKNPNGDQTEESEQVVEYSESNSKITITSMNPSNTQKMIFTPVGLLSQYEFQTNELIASTKIEWESINQAWVPSLYRFSYRFRSERTDNEDNRTHVRVVVFTKHSVNTPESSNEFSLHALGLREGDLIHDTRNGSTRVITEAD